MKAPMTFDQLQRYRLAGEILEALRPRRPLRILDAGSREGFLKNFLPDDRIVNLDRLYFDGKSLVLGDVLALPFPASAFAAAVSLDVLEHVPASRRPAFLEELARVSEDLIVISAPFANEDVAAAEKLVNEFCLRVTGKENEFLSEHLSTGLPRQEEVLEWARARGFAAVVIPNAYLPRWAAMMCLNSYLAHLPDPWNLIFTVNELYDREFSSGDNRSPAYRRFVVIRKNNALPAEEILRRFSSPEEKSAGMKEAWEFLSRAAGIVEAGQDEALRELRERCAVLEDLERRREKEVRELVGMVERLQRDKEEEARRLAGIIDGKSAEIRELSGALEETGRALKEHAAELERIRNTMGYKFYRKIFGRWER